MKIIYCILFFIFSFINYLSASSTIGEWKSYLSYYDSEQITETNNLVFGVANGSLFSYNKEDKSIETYSKANGLNGDSIASIGFNKNTNSLLLFYSDGNIDIFTEKEIHNISFLKDKTKDKTINSIYFKDKLAYLSLGFGIMVVDMDKKVIKDTYELETNTYSVCIKDKDIYAATDNGLLKSTTDKNLLNKASWEHYIFSTGDINTRDIRKIILFNDLIYYLVKTKGIYYETDNQNLKVLLTNSQIKNIKTFNNRLVAYNDKIIYTYTNNSSFHIVKADIIKDVSSFSENDYWIASGEEGLREIRKKANSDEQEVIIEGLKINSPKRNLFQYMTMHNEKLLVVGGGRWSNRYNSPGTLMTFEKDNWFNFNESEIGEAAKVNCRDFTSVAVDPKNPNHYFVSSWGEGIYEFKDNKFVRLYTDKETTLESAIANSKGFIRVDGLCYDKYNNLWITNSEVSNGIKVLTSEGKWKKIYYENLSKIQTIDKILITKRNQKWVNIPRQNIGIFIFDDNNTIDNTTDDKSYFFSRFYDQDDKLVDVTGYFCMAEDKNGAIWVGTSKGPIVFNNPSRALDLKDKFRCSRIKIPYNDGTNKAYYLMDTEKITAIAVDGGNRKWLGTESSGLFLVSEDGTETLENFTTSNSPLPSNNILSLAINDINGEVFIGTDKGLVSYQGIAIEGKEDYSEVYAFPNPVREDYNGIITITGLMENSLVKITDLNGNIIYQGKSLGGQIGWDGHNSNGEFVKTGIYLVLAIQEEGKESVVTKIMVVR